MKIERLFPKNIKTVKGKVTLLNLAFLHIVTPKNPLSAHDTHKILDLQ